MSARPWTVRRSRGVLRDRWIDVTADAVEDARGNLLDPYYTLAYPDWAQVVAVTEDGALVLVRQYRHGLRDLSLELPAGCVDPGEAPLDAGLRELREETGYAPAEARLVASLSPNTATHRNRCHTVLALGCRRVAGQRLEPGEDIAVELRPWRDVLDRLHEGLLPQAMHVSALLLAARELGWLTTVRETPMEDTP